MASDLKACTTAQVVEPSNEKDSQDTSTTRNDALDESTSFPKLRDEEQGLSSDLLGCEIRVATAACGSPDRSCGSESESCKKNHGELMDDSGTDISLLNIVRRRSQDICEEKQEGKTCINDMVQDVSLSKEHPKELVVDATCEEKQEKEHPPQVMGIAIGTKENVKKEAIHPDASSSKVHPQEVAGIGGKESVKKETVLQDFAAVGIAAGGPSGEEPGAYLDAPGAEPQRAESLAFASLAGSHLSDEEMATLGQDSTPGAYAEAPGQGALRLDCVTALPNNVEPCTDDEDDGTATQDLSRALSIEDESVELSRALAIEDESVQDVELQPYDLDASQRKRNKAKREKCALVLEVVLAVVAVLILVPVLVLVPEWGSSEGGGDLSNKSPTLYLENRVLSLLPEHTLAALEQGKNSSQSQAFDWITADPNLMTYSDERLVQRYALATFYFATSGDDWRHKTNWMSYQVHECDWHAQDYIKIAESFGIFDMYSDAILNVSFAVGRKVQSYPCEDPVGEQKYQHLWLPANRLQGSIPPELYLLTSLKSINLAVNALRGNGLSTEIGKLSSLEGVFMQTTGCGGTIPTQVGLLSSLHSLYLTTNRLTGTIPTQLSLLSDQNLRALELSENDLTGTIPTSLGSLTEIVFFDLSGNQLTGTIPPELGNLKMVKAVFSLGTNQLEGTIPTELGKLKNIQHLYLYENRLTGFIPTEFGLLQSSVRLGLFQNYLSGEIPTELGLLKESTWLILGENKLEGPIPSELGMLEKLQELKLDTNTLTGSIPLEIVNLIANGNLEEFNIYGNNLTGILHDDLCSIDTISDYKSDLTGCTCTCRFEFPWHPGVSLCSPLPDRCT